MSRPDPEPYDSSQPFDAAELMGGFVEEERIVRAEDDPVLAEMAARARRAYAAFNASQEAP